MAIANQQLIITAALDESNLDTSLFVKVKEYLMIITTYSSWFGLCETKCDIAKKREKVCLELFFRVLGL